MGKPLPAVRRISFVVDIEGYSRRTAPGQVDAQGRLLWTVTHALRAAGVSSTECERQDQGDGQLIILPPGVDEARVPPTLILAMHSALHRVNAVPGEAGRLRMRVALAQGPVQIAPTGFVGAGVVDACRILDSDPPRQALKRHGEADLVVIVSADLYHQVFAQDYTAGLTGREFQPVKVVMSAKGYRADAYLYVPGASPAPGLVPDFTGAYEKESRLPWRVVVPATAVTVTGLWWGYEALRADHAPPAEETASPLGHRLGHGPQHHHTGHEQLVGHAELGHDLYHDDHLPGLDDGYEALAHDHPADWWHDPGHDDHDPLSHDDHIGSSHLFDHHDADFGLDDLDR